MDLCLGSWLNEYECRSGAHKKSRLSLGTIYPYLLIQASEYFLVLKLAASALQRTTLKTSRGLDFSLLDNSAD